MSKELEALKEIEAKYQNDNGLLRRLDIIETALKEYETIKDVRITARFDLNQVSKEHRALEIIKKYYEVNYEGTDLQIIPQNLTDLKQYYADMELLQELML